jgi:hypothetical protein
MPGMPYLRQVVGKGELASPVADDGGELADDETGALRRAASVSSALMP